MSVNLLFFFHPLKTNQAGFMFAAPGDWKANQAIRLRLRPKQQTNVAALIVPDTDGTPDCPTYQILLSDEAPPPVGFEPGDNVLDNRETGHNAVHEVVSQLCEQAPRYFQGVGFHDLVLEATTVPPDWQEVTRFTLAEGVGVTRCNQLMLTLAEERWFVKGSSYTRPLRLKKYGEHSLATALQFADVWLEQLYSMRQRLMFGSPDVD